LNKLEVRNGIKQKKDNRKDRSVTVTMAGRKGGMKTAYTQCMSFIKR
jgi:hypothetical protein